MSECMNIFSKLYLQVYRKALHSFIYVMLHYWRFTRWIMRTCSAHFFQEDILLKVCSFTEVTISYTCSGIQFQYLLVFFQNLKVSSTELLQGPIETFKIFSPSCQFRPIYNSLWKADSLIRLWAMSVNTFFSYYLNVWGFFVLFLIFLPNICFLL